MAYIFLQRWQVSNGWDVKISALFFMASPCLLILEFYISFGAWKNVGSIMALECSQALETFWTNMTLICWRGRACKQSLRVSICALFVMASFCLYILELYFAFEAGENAGSIMALGWSQVLETFRTHMTLIFCSGEQVYNRETSCSAHCVMANPRLFILELHFSFGAGQIAGSIMTLESSQVLETLRLSFSVAGASKQWLRRQNLRIISHG